MRRADLDDSNVTRRALLGSVLGLSTIAACGGASAQGSVSFATWIEAFRARARARGITDAVYDRVMRGMTPDTEIFDLQRRQPEFTETVWQYLNRRVSEWRIMRGRECAVQHAELLARIESRYGVDRFALLSIWGNESSFGAILDNPRIMRSVPRSLATLAWGDPRRRAYWEQELLNALVIVQRGWANPEQMVGSWAGAMGHTQFMPEAWLNASVDFNGDGRRNLFEIPDALASSAYFLKTRGRWQTGKPWGFEVRPPAGFNAALADGTQVRKVADWQRFGLTRPDREPFPAGDLEARARFPMGVEGPGFLLFQNFRAFLAYNPSFNYALAVGHLADRIRGKGPLVQAWPGQERQLSTDELSEMQQILVRLGHDTGGTDGRVGDMTRRAIRAFQERAGIAPADGWPTETVLRRLRITARGT
jgi:lytic murein transglycosylase